MFERFVCYLINSFCCLLYSKEYKSYINSVNISKIQQNKLFDIIEKNKYCEYGKKCNFEHIASIDEYQSRVPVTCYEDYLDYIEKIKNGEKNILTCEDILLLELTSGSVSASKLIPYTKSLKDEFQKGLKPWIYSLYSGYRGLKWGKSYWSITPATTQNEYTKGGLPIGFEEDSEYFGKLEKKLLDVIFAVPKDIAKVKDMEVFYYETALSLLKCKNLSFISVWNPTFLFLLLDYMKKHGQSLSRDITRKDRKRGLDVSEFLAKEEYTRLWRHLKVISCWCDANAKEYADRLKALFPGVCIQPKGLLATEGFISFPFPGEDGARISINSHFFEFLSIEDNRVYLVHELEQGKQYSVIITTSGGLYRYKLNDIIEVTGFCGKLPLIRFKGKQDKVSDLFGEKLNEVFVKNTIESLKLKPEFYMVAPESDRYVLYIKSDKVPQDVDQLLRANFHYDYCRKLGQLKELKVFKLTGNPEKEYLDECVKRGQRLGDIKPSVLQLKGGWDKVFEGEYL